MSIDALEETLARLDREHRRPKFIYTIPTFQNPAGVTMSLPRAAGSSRSRASAS
jgi:2-aminoadipate transaminase